MHTHTDGDGGQEKADVYSDGDDDNVPTDDAASAMEHGVLRLGHI